VPVSVSERSTHHEPDYDLAVDSLVTRLGGAVTRDEAQAAVDDARREIEPGSTVHDFLELLVERRAFERLRAGARTGAAPRAERV
jgi:hypothetical protein